MMQCNSLEACLCLVKAFMNVLGSCSKQLIVEALTVNLCLSPTSPSSILFSRSRPCFNKTAAKLKVQAACCCSPRLICWLPSELGCLFLVWAESIALNCCYVSSSGPEKSQQRTDLGSSCVCNAEQVPAISNGSECFLSTAKRNLRSPPPHI